MMLSFLKRVTQLFMLLIVMSVFGVTKVRAQSITPAQDGTGTNVTTNGNQYDIDGGSLSGDGANLFHSFEQFGLSQGEIANFSSNPNLVNILGRIRGGDPSMINGLIQVTGGNSHLFLMNPAGFVFGDSAALNVPGNFTVTTANGIQFGSGWFNATGVNDYQGLVGNPTGLGFTMAQPGAIVNEGNLAVGAGRDLSLVGGTVVNTGELQAPGGGVVVSAVPGENLVRLSIPGNVLSLEVEPLGESQPNGWNLPITALPDLLTVGASGVQGNPDGTVQVAVVQVPGDAGTAIVSGEVDVSGEMGGNVGVFGDKVAVVGAEIDASGVKGGGKVWIGGDYKGEGIVPNAQRTLVDGDSVINADAGVNGDGGEVIVWADEATGFDGSITARGGSESGNGGFAEVSGKENLSFNGTADLGAANGNSGTLLLDPENIVIVNGDGGADDGEVTGDSQILDGDSPGSTFTISENALEGLPAGTDIILEATNDITINDLADNFLTFAPGSSVTFSADAGVPDGIGSFSMNLGDTVQAEGGTVRISGNSLTVGKLDAFLIFVDTSGLLNVQAPIEATSLNLTADEINLLEGAPIEASSIDLTADEINLLGGTGSVVTNSISLEPRFNQNVIVGGNVDSGSETLDITTDDLDAITPLFPLDENTLPQFNVVSGTITVQGSLKADGIEFTANEIDLLGGAGSVVTNFISLKPNFDQNIIVGGSGDSGSETLDITTDDLDALTPLNRNSLPSISIEGFDSNTLTVQTPIEARSIDLTADEINLLEGASLEATLIDLTADEINLLGGAGSVVTNSISFRNLNTDSNIIVGGNADSGSETLDITTDDLEALAPVDGNTLPRIFVGSFGTLTVQSPIEASDIFLSAADEIALLAGASLEASDIRLTADEIALLAGASLKADVIEFRADEIDFLGGSGSVVTNSISIESQFNQNIIVGGNADSGSENLDITTDDLNSITFQDDSPSIDISRANNITAVSGSTPLQFNASLSLNANTITVERIFDVDGDISFNSTGTTQINSTVQATSLITNAGGETQINSDIITTGTEGQNYNDNVRIDDNVTLDSNNNPINFNGTVNSQTGETNDLTANAGTANITLNSSVGNTQPLGNLQFNTTGNTQINSTLQAASLTTNAGGESQLNGNITTTGTEGQNYNDNVRIDDNVTLNSNNNPITINGTVNSQTGETNDLTANAGTGNVTVNSQVGNTQPLGNIQVNSTGTTRFNDTVQAANLATNAGGETQLNANVTTTGTEGQNYNDNVRIDDNLTLDSNDNPININGTINSQSGETNNLNINSGDSNTSLSADVGNTSPIGDVNINSTNDINTQNLTANTINLTSENNVNTGNLNTSSTTENGGDISLEGTTVTTGNLNSSGINGGNISIEATTSIETGTINSSGTSGNGGDVTLDPENDIEVSSINAQGGANGVGGNVDITTEQNFRATGTFTDQNGTNASISTAGGQEGGSVTIRHGGGSQNIPFVVGDATTNGTAAAITTGTDNTIAPVQSFPGSHSQGTPPNEIQIITTPPSPANNPEVVGKRPTPPIQTEPQRSVETIVYEIEDRLTTQANQYLGETTTTQIKTLDEIRQDLRRIVETTKGEVKPGIIYAFFLPRGPVVRPELDGNKIPPISDIALEVPLELMLVTSEGDVITKSMFEATRTKVFSQANNFLSSVDSRSKEGTKDYKEPAEQFYDWLIRPIEEELKAQGINNLVFVMDEGLRSLPLAALRDRQENKFIIEQGYSIGLTPSMSLINIREADTRNTLQNARVLAMGASEFKTLPPLPGVETEIELILNLWQGVPFPNEEFTKDNLKSAQDTGAYKIVHLATHANFEPSPLGHSFIQFGDGVVGLDDIKTLGLDDPLVELLVLSACKTASGNKDAELGFAGIARLTGVKSVLGSLWKINDIGNLGLMTEFYTQLKTAPTKAEALRQAQVAMLEGNVKFENGDLVGEQYRISLPEELNVDNRTLSHPYYWSGFTMIGNPW